MPSEYIPSPDHWHQEFVRFKKLLPTATIPTRGSADAAGLDFSSIKSTTLAPGETRCIKTGLACEYSDQMYLRIAPRSGNALKGIIVNGGVIDRYYRGDIGAILHNTSMSPFTIKPGQKIAQGIFEKHGNPKVYVTDSLSTTTRDKGGFGSTDSKNRTKKKEGKRVHLCHLTDTDVFQIDKTRGPGKMRARRMPPTSILQNPIIVPPTSSPKTMSPHPTDTIPTTDPELINMNTPEQPSSTPPTHTFPDLAQQSQQAPADNIDLSSWMSWIDLQHPPNHAPPPEDDDNIEELYSDFTAENQDAHRSPPTIQRTSPATINP